MSFKRYLAANYEKGEVSITPKLPESEKIGYAFAKDLAGENLIGNFSTCVYRAEALWRLPFDL